MASSVVPFADVAGDRVRDFLRQIGFDPQIIEWKYFDPAFNRGRNRGYAWLQGDRVAGMIGLIPFTMASGARARAVHWSCDWMLADPAASPGVGIILLKRAMAASEAVIGLGGNENTRKLIPRIATRTMPDAALTLYLPLRSGAILEKLEQRLLHGRPRTPRFLHRLPLRLVPRSGRRADVRTEPGVARAAAPLFELECAAGWHPRYDFAHVDWQIGRCPALVSCTTYSPADSPQAVAVCWRPAASGTFWRTALWWNRERPEHLETVVREAISNVFERGGAALSAMVSRSDATLLDRLKRLGFLTLGQPRAVYLCAGGAGTEPLPELSGLSYLDGDLAYRF